MNGQLNNFWGAGFNLDKRIVGYDDRLTRGRPIVRSRAGEGIDRRIGGNIQIRPVENWTHSLGPSWSRSLTYAQYVTSVADSTAQATYGRRYIFTGLEQTQLSLETPLNVTLRPELSLEAFVQPLLSSGDYGALPELRMPRTYTFNEYGVDAGTIAFEPVENDFTIGPDGPGPAATFTVANRDLNTRSLGATRCCVGNIGLARRSIWCGNGGARLPNRLATSTSGVTRGRSSTPAPTTSSS